MFPDKIQSTVFFIEVVPIDEDYDPEKFPVNDRGNNRLRVREVATLMTTGCMTGSVTDPTCVISPPTETDLTYKIIPPGGSVLLDGNTITFENAGLQCWSTGIGNGDVPCSVVPSMALDALISLIPALNAYSSDNQSEESGQNIEEIGTLLLDQPLGPNAVVALPNCFAGLYGDGIVEEAKERVVTSTRVFDFHVHARFAASGATTPASDLADRAGSAYALVPPRDAMVQIPVDDLPSDAGLQPLIWFPLANHEAFAFGAITSDSSMRLFGRLGGMTEGYRVTPETHWLLNDEEMRILMFREDRDPRQNTSEKHVEFDAGSLFPGDVDTKMNEESLDLLRQPVPFFIGAMPMEDPANLSVLGVSGSKPTLKRTGGGPIDFSYLAAELDTPIVFDPVTNCTAC